jgi:hypothetical protein
MKRQHFIRGMGALLGAVVFGPALTACGGGEDLTGVAEADDPTAVAAGRGGPRTNTPSTTDPATTVTVTPSSLDANEIAALRYLREEEKLAHDVYVALFSRWSTRVFSQIAESETQHTEAVLGQIKLHGLDDPAAGKAAGQFEDAFLQSLYDELIRRGAVSQVEALKVACLIEETDIKDLRDKMALTDEPGILSVYQNLLCGSYNHLQSFNRVLASKGGSYQSQVISQAEWNAIAAGTATCNA